MPDLETIIEQNNVGQVIKIMDPKQNSTDFGYDAYLRLTSINYEDGGETLFKYGDTNDDVTENATVIQQKVREAVGIQPQKFIKTQIESDEFSNLVKIVNLTDDITTDVGHDDLHRVNHIERETGASISYKYDALNRIIEINDLRNGTTTVTFDDNVKYRNIDEGWLISRTKSVVNPEGDGTVFYYDIFGRLVATRKSVEVEGESKDVFWKYEWDKRNRLTEERNPVQRIVKYHYDDLDRLWQREVNSTREFFEYNNLHQKEKYTDPRGKVTHFEYDGYDRLEIILRPLKDTVIFGYDENGNITSIDHNGRVTIRDHDPRNLLASVIDPEQNTTTLGRDLLQRLISITDPKNNTRRWRFDSRNNIRSFTDEENNSATFIYNRDNGLKTSEEPRGPRTKKIYTTYHSGEVASVVNTKSHRTDYVRDKLGRISKVRFHALNLVVDIEYNSFNKIKSVTLPDQSKWEYGYDEIGRLRQIKSPEGRTNHFRYDPLNRLRLNFKGEFFDPWNFRYDNNNNLTIVRNPLGGIVERTYDDLNRVETMTPFGRAPIKYRYDVFNKWIKIIDSNGKIVRIDLDKNDFPTKITDQENKKILLQPDKNSQLKLFGLEDENDIYVQEHEYYPTGRLKKISFADDSEINFEYDPNGNIKQLTDEEGLVTTFIYGDVFDIPTEFIAPDQSLRTTEYDALGRPLKIRSGSTTSYKYDDIKRTTLITTSSGRKAKIFYSEDGNFEKVIRHPFVSWPIVSLFFNFPETTYKYDHDNRLLQVTNTLNDSVKYHNNGLGQLEGFDVNNNPTGEIVVFNDDGTIDTIEDANGIRKYIYNLINGRLEAISFADNRTTTFEYYDNGAVRKVIHSDGTVKEYDYDHSKSVSKIIEGNNTIILLRDNRLRVFKEEIQPENQVNIIRYYKNGIVARINEIEYQHNPTKGQLDILKSGSLSFSYDYYDNGWIKDISTNDGYFRRFRYDADGRVIKVETTGRNFSIKYDYLGNPKLVSVFDGLFAIRKDRYKYDTESSLRFINPGKPQEIVYSYDARGNLIFERDNQENIVKKRVLDWSNQLYELITNGVVSELHYDSKGNLIQIKNEDGTQTEYRYDDENRLRAVLRNGNKVEEFEYDSLDRLVKDRTTDRNRRLTHAYIYPIKITENGKKQEIIPDKEYAWPMAMIENNGILIPSWILGNSTVHHDEAGNILGEQSRLPYGDKETGDLDQNPFGFKGYPRFLTENIRWAFTRNYNPDIKYFLNPDLLRGDPFDPISINRRRVFSNSPLRYLDFLGLQDDDMCVGSCSFDEDIVEGSYDSGGQSGMISVSGGPGGVDAKPEPLGGISGNGGEVDYSSPVSKTRRATPQELAIVRGITNTANQIANAVGNLEKEIDVTPPKIYQNDMITATTSVTPTIETQPEQPSPAENYGNSLDNQIEKLKAPKTSLVELRPFKAEGLSGDGYVRVQDQVYMEESGDIPKAKKVQFRFLRKLGLGADIEIKPHDTFGKVIVEPKAGSGSIGVGYSFSLSRLVKWLAETLLPPPPVSPYLFNYPMEPVDVSESLLEGLQLRSSISILPASILPAFGLKAGSLKAGIRYSPFMEGRPLTLQADFESVYFYRVGVEIHGEIAESILAAGLINPFLPF